MVVSCFRWLLVDHFHSLTGLGAPAFNARALEERPAAFTYLVESHYRYYQFYANTLVAVVWTYGVHRYLAIPTSLGFGTDVGAVVLCAALFAGSRDALSKYRARSRQLVVQVLSPDFDGAVMTNGIDHQQGGGAKGKPATSEKPSGKPEVPTKPQTPPSGSTPDKA